MPLAAPAFRGPAPGSSKRFAMHSILRPVLSLLLGVAFLLSANGILFTYLPLRGQAEGFGAPALGLIASCYYVGFVSGCLLSPYIILRAGHIRSFAAAVALACAATLAYSLMPQVLVWSLLRFVTGFCLAAFYLVIESWLNERASNATRGMIMSSYIIVNFGAITIGQMMTTLYPLRQASTLVLAGILAALAIIPVALTRSAQPAPIAAVRFSPRNLLAAAPVALVGSFVIGIANGAFWGLAPLSAAAIGLSVNGVALFMAAAVLAGALAQWPIGRLSDRLDRRKVLLASLLLAAAAGFALWLSAASGLAFGILGALFGALALPGYSLAAAHGFDKTTPGEVVANAATILLANGLGSIIGPLVASGLMISSGPRGLFLFTAIVQALLAIYVLHRIRLVPTLTPMEKTEFDLAATAALGAVTPAEGLDIQNPDVMVPEDYAPAPRAAP